MHHWEKEGKNTACKCRDHYGEARRCCYTYFRGLSAFPSFPLLSFPAADNLSDTFAQGETLCGNLQVGSGLVSCEQMEFHSVFFKQGLVFQGKELTSGSFWGARGVAASLSGTQCNVQSRWERHNSPHYQPVSA